METHLFHTDFSQQKDFYVLLCSDLHLDAPETDRALLLKDLTRALSLNARILINGDVFNALVPSDAKRYTKSVDTFAQRDDVLNLIVQQGVDLLLPYVNLIDVIGLGNHEKEILKRHHVDLTALLLSALNAKRDPALPLIRHGGYCGFVRFVYHIQGGCAKSYDLFYNHGQGGTSEVTKGMIDLSRYAGHIAADAIWLGHKHTRGVWQLDPLIGVSAKNKLVTKQRYGIITGCYGRQVKDDDITVKGYQLDFGEEKMRVPVARGGVFLCHHVSTRELTTDVLC